MNVVRKRKKKRKIMIMIRIKGKKRIELDNGMTLIVKGIVVILIIIAITDIIFEIIDGRRAEIAVVAS